MTVKSAFEYIYIFSDNLKADFHWHILMILSISFEMNGIHFMVKI
jgi:hypothetical protein